MPPKKIRVAVVMGGTSTEHDVSINSGSNVCSVLPKTTFDVLPVIICMDGKWKVGNDWIRGSEEFTGLPGDNAAVDPLRATGQLLEKGIDVVFIVLHGPGGEDGVIQGFFETAGLPYTGSGVLGNAVGMDKIIFKRIISTEGIATPDFITADCSSLEHSQREFAEIVVQRLGLPCVAKISNQGSSHNIGIAKSVDELTGMLTEFSSAGDELLVEEFIDGREITCAVIDRPGEIASLALPPTELVPKSSTWFDYHAKYTPGATDEITPARINEEQTREIQRIAVVCHKVAHCGGMSRTDTILRNNTFYVTEINTIPGLTSTSLIPQAAAVAGISFPELLEIQVRWALEQRGK
jgi:D-alanine-D-alanine ligase